MKNILFVILFLAGNLAIAQNIRIITYNIRYNNQGDGVNAWPNRSKDVAALLDFHKADIFGLQDAFLQFEKV